MTRSLEELNDDQAFIFTTSSFVNDALGVMPEEEVKAK